MAPLLPSDARSKADSVGFGRKAEIRPSINVSQAPRPDVCLAVWTITRRSPTAAWHLDIGQRYALGARGVDPQAATLEGSNCRTVIAYRPLVVWSACATLFRFADAPLLPLYSPGKSRQTADAANGVTGSASQRLVLRRSRTGSVSLPDWPNEKCRLDRDTGIPASTWRGVTCGPSRTKWKIVRLRRQ
jgi:hypothetical protein